MITYTSNISQVVKIKIAQLKEMAGEGDKLARTVAFAVLPELKKRVHIDGKDASGNQIGIYSSGYMKVRTGAFLNADKFSKGKDKGKNKNAGTFTEKSTNKSGSARPKYNRTSDTKVILSLTRQMENDLSIIASGKGYGIGYNNPFNYQKSQWAESTYKKDIWKLTAEEKALANTVAVDYVNQKLKNS